MLRPEDIPIGALTGIRGDPDIPLVYPLPGIPLGPAVFQCRTPGVGRSEGEMSVSADSLQLPIPSLLAPAKFNPFLLYNAIIEYLLTESGLIA